MHLAQALDFNLLCHGSAEAISVPSFLSEGVGHFRLAGGRSPTAMQVVADVILDKSVTPCTS